jgi:hypothetical protein
VGAGPEISRDDAPVAASTMTEASIVHEKIHEKIHEACKRCRSFHYPCQALHRKAQVLKSDDDGSDDGVCNDAAAYNCP